MSGRRTATSQASPTVTVSTVRHRRMPVDELSRGREGMALVIDERSAMAYVELTPWFRSEPWRSVVEREGPQLVTQLDRQLGRQLGPQAPEQGIDLDL